MKKIKRVAVNEVALYNAIAVTEHDAITAQSEHELNEKNNTNLLSELDALKSTLKVAEKNMATLVVENEALLDRLQNSIDTKEYKTNVLYITSRFNDKVVEHHYLVDNIIVDIKNARETKLNRVYSLLNKDSIDVITYLQVKYETVKHNLYQKLSDTRLKLSFDDIIKE
jgi:hypothetical protein